MEFNNDSIMMSNFPKSSVRIFFYLCHCIWHLYHHYCRCTLTLLHLRNSKLWPKIHLLVQWNQNKMWLSLLCPWRVQWWKCQYMCHLDNIHQNHCRTFVWKLHLWSWHNHSICILPDILRQNCQMSGWRILHWSTQVSKP